MQKSAQNINVNNLVMAWMLLRLLEGVLLSWQSVISVRNENSISIPGILAQKEVQFELFLLVGS